jgi:hypothetical protein
MFMSDRPQTRTFVEQTLNTTAINFYKGTTRRIHHQQPHPMAEKVITHSGNYKVYLSCLNGDTLKARKKKSHSKNINIRAR